MTLPELLAPDPGSGDLRLVGGYSPTSDRHHFPLSSVCPYSGADDVEPRLLSPEGTLWAWTVVTAAPPGYSGPVPYGFGVVELPEGIRIITRLVCSDPADLGGGQPVRLITETVPTGAEATPDVDTEQDPTLEIYAFEAVETS